jgi:hypothetical protein
MTNSDNPNIEVGELFDSYLDGPINYIGVHNEQDSPFDGWLTLGRATGRTLTTYTIEPCFVDTENRRISSSCARTCITQTIDEGGYSELERAFMDLQDQGM